MGRQGPVTCPFEFNPVLAGASLLQQFMVDVGCKIITERCLWLRLNQSTIRADQYSNLLNLNGVHPSEVGQRIILPATHYGSPRFMLNLQLDSMAIMRRHGKPHFFITFTCNPSWREITDNIYPNQQPLDRPDIVSRVFNLKQKVLVEMMCSKKVLGDCVADVENEEYQKRDLPHTHNLFWIKDMAINPQTIDAVVTAELPDQSEDPELHRLVLRHMIHGPCGAFNPAAPCMVNGKCSKGFPQDYRNYTEIGENCYPNLRRRSPEDGGGQAEKIVSRGGSMVPVMITNAWVVPYNKFLLKQFQCHLNVLICATVSSIKYVLKYTNKGDDRAVFDLQSDDEISAYQSGKYLGPHESAALIFGLQRHRINPTVVSLEIHLENGQRVLYADNDPIETVMANANRPTKLTAFFAVCQADNFAQTLFYYQIPEYYTWNVTNKMWCRRKRGGQRIQLQDGTSIVHSTTIGRIYNVSPTADDLYYLRLLLINVKGPRSFLNLKTFNGIASASFKDCCQRRGLLDNDDHLHAAMLEIKDTCNASCLRNLFVTIMTSCFPGNPLYLWSEFVNDMLEDEIYEARINANDHTLQITDEMRHSLLYKMNEAIINSGGRPLTEQGFIIPERVDNRGNPYIMRELQDIEEETAIASAQIAMLNAEQKDAFDAVLRSLESAANDNLPTMFFIHAGAGIIIIQ